MQTNVQIDSKNLRSSPDLKHRGHITIEVREFVLLILYKYLFNKYLKQTKTSVSLHTIYHITDS